MIETPPQTKGVLDAAESLLIEANLLGYSSNGGLVVADGDQLAIDEADPLEKPDPAPNGFWWRVVLMEVINGIQFPMQYPDNTREYKFYVRVDVQPPNDAFDSEFFLGTVHNRCYHALHYQRVSFEGARDDCPIIRKTHPSAMFRDDVKGFRYSSAEYLTILGPT